MMDELTSVLAQLPEPAPPPTLTATVMARIEREVERKADAGATVPARRPREQPAWLWTLVGVGVVLGVSIYGWLTTGSVPDFASSRIGLGRASLLPVEGPALLVLGLGLLVYLAGLFAPLRSGGQDLS